MLKQRHQLFVTLLALSDALVIVLACVLALLVRAWAGLASGVSQSLEHGPSTLMLRQWAGWSLILLAVPLGLISMRLLGLYRPWRDRHLWAESKRAVQAALVTVIAIIVVAWIFSASPTLKGMLSAGATSMGETSRVLGVDLDGPRLQLISLCLLLAVGLTAERAVFRLALRQLRTRGRNLRHVAVIGTGRLGRIACRTLDRNSWTGIHVAYFIDHMDEVQPGRKGTLILDRPVKGGLRDLAHLMEHDPVDAVYLALPTSRAARVPELLVRLERFPTDVRIIPDVSPRHSPLAMGVSELEGMPILSVRESPMAGLPGVVKRCVDIAGAIVGLAIFGLPMLVIAAVVRCSGPGPVLFRQRRVSLGGEEFWILKFRTMSVGGTGGREGGQDWTRRDDPRVTRVGRLLRRTSLDELPQLVNVLLGEMSLVGPRPERPELIERFREDWRGYVLRQHVKAGMTGWAQVNGLRGDTSLRKRVQHDLFYIRHWSLGFDLKILWLTLFRGFVHRNAI